MSFDALTDLNWLAVIVAAVAWFVLGAIWYAPPAFGRAWQQATGVQVAEGQRPNPASLVVTFAAYFVAAVATAMLAEATGSDRFEEGVALGLVAGIGYSLTLLGVGAVFEKRPQTSTWLAINGVYNVLGLLIVAVIVTVWD